ncbi:adrenodoxin-like [Syngnathoides biaculeatus]|uniref:adrenodoxin-like n=1 Tax=Syngnathoides biaculeatus TaxID=300417 RepID=UPI002ADD420B|nr:adrenodoxin-like [Syngnathoides biaculeatus]XP_061658267.1 adrenodoxin-like [Syngnathoides biaculeatus]
MASLLTAFRRIAHVGVREYARRSAVSRAATGDAGRRSFVTGTEPLRSDSKVTVHFINRDGEKITVEGSPGDSLLDVVINEDLDFDGFGACEGTLACSTCHLIFDQDVYNKLGPVTDEEMDMLDLAYGLTDTSRLGCQICLSRSLDGVVARVPESVADIRQSQDGSSSGLFGGDGR